MNSLTNYSLDGLLEKVKSKNSQIDLDLIKRAYYFADQAHHHQKRTSGEDYIYHPLRATYRLVDLTTDSTTLAAELLHDVVDDTPVTQKEIEQKFGRQVAFLVGGVTKLGKIKYRGIEREVENLRKIFLAMAEDLRVVLIKLCDRWDNMETLFALPERKQKRIALETLEIYTPLAHRLGIGEIKGQLEDLAFIYAYPEKYQWLIKEVKEKYEERKIYISWLKPLAQQILDKEGIRILEIQARAKHYWSLYKKLQRYEMDINKIYDLVALRIIVGNVEECYQTLGVIHQRWKPLPGRIKDYIALPKPNNYRSLHTTVFCEKGKITEFQVRTEEMHQEAEYGIAAHWYYSEKKGTDAFRKRISPVVPMKKFAWVKQLKEWQQEVRSPDEFLDNLRLDFFRDRIFVFTPKGDVIDLPEGATPVDFAYHIHSEVGDHCYGARVDGKIIPLNYPLKNGQIVEIITQKKINVNAGWLEFVKTNVARSLIRKWLRKHNLVEKVKGSERRNKQRIEKKEFTNKSNRTIKTDGKIENKRMKIDGVFPEIPWRLAKCCSPDLTNPIVGYITLNRGITVHRKDCPNLKKLNPKKIINLRWRK